jgi:uncharacterized protein
LTGPGQAGPGENDPIEPAADAGPGDDPPGDDLPAPDDGSLALDDGSVARPGPERLGLRTFSLDGRQAPGLYLVGWLGSLLGAAAIFIVLLAQPHDLAGAILLGAGTLILTVGLCSAAGSQAIERQAAGQLAYRGPSPVLLFGATIGLTLLFEILALAPLAALGVSSDSPLEALVGLLILNLSALSLIVLLVVGTNALTWREMGVPLPGAGWSMPRLVADLLVGMALALPILFLSGLIGQVMIDLLGVVPSAPLPPAGSAAGAILNIISGVLIAPLGEELFYRGFATTAWVRDLGVRSGIGRAALLFLVAHVLTLSGPPATALIAFVVRIPIALALGWIFVRRGSLAASFGMHAMFNAIPLVLVGLSVG